MLVGRPKYASLDTSQINALVRDKFSTDPILRKKAKKFEIEMLESGYVLLMCWHQFEEMLNHENDQVVENRVSYIQSLDLIAWIAPYGDVSGFGSVMDILIFEVEAAFNIPEATSLQVRDAVRSKLIRTGTGASAILPYSHDWREIRVKLWKRAKRAREVAAISGSKTMEMHDHKTKIYSLISGAQRSPDDRDGILKGLEKNLVEDIKKHGDRRLGDAEAAAKKFYQDLFEERIEKYAKTSNPVIAMLIDAGIEKEDINKDTTLGDVLSLSKFNSRLKVAGDRLSISFPSLKSRVRYGSIPSEFIQDELRQFREKAHERKGSDLSDTYLACLAPYADVTYVDKRIKEACTQACRRSKQFSLLVKKIEKTARYEDIHLQLTI